MAARDAGDVLVVWELDRLSRSLKDLLHIMERVLQMLGELRRIRTVDAGLAAARERGVKVGRPAKLSRCQQKEVIRTVRDGSKTAADAARLFGTVKALLAYWRALPTKKLQEIGSSAGTIAP
jgi:DNA invertase Pin-like site-specific DNA recombinase